MSPITNVAAIDAGSNAIRVVVASASAHGITRIESERIPVRLGHNAFTHGALDSETIEAAAAAFARIRLLFERHHVERYRAVATSALRCARNTDLLLRRIEHDSQIEIDVIDGEEEARLTRVAVLEATRDRPTPALIFDLGGGSLETAVRRTDATWWSTTRPIGTVRLIETFGLDGAISEEEARMVKRYVRTPLLGVDVDLRGEGEVLVGPAVACGGNAEALAHILGDRDERGQAVLGSDKLRALLPAVLALGVEGRMQRFGVSRDRAEVIAVAALVLWATARAFRLPQLEVPGVGVRDGLLLELAEEVSEGQSTTRHARDQTLIAAARQFGARLGHTPAHGEHVRRLSRMIFDELSARYQLDPRLGVVLEVAAILHDVGECVNRSSHHKHSEYLIRAGRIPGLETPEREMVAAIARAHRKSPPDAKKHESYAILDPVQQRAVRELAAIVRLADSLDTDHRGRIKSVTASPANGELVLTLHLCESTPDGPALWLRKADVFEEVFGTPLRIETQRVPN